MTALRQLLLSLLILVPAAVPAAQAKPTTQSTDSGTITAAELVEAVRRNEAWIEDVDSLLIRFESRWTSPGKEGHRKELKQQPGEEPEQPEMVTIAFDTNRLLYLSDNPGNSYRVSLWDGSRHLTYSKYFTHEQEHHGIGTSFEKLGDHLLTSLMWPRAGPHSFWWRPRDIEEIMFFYGEPEEFSLVGKETYRGIECYVLERRDGWERWHVSVARPHLRHCRTSLSVPNSFDHTALARQIAQEHGVEIETWDQWKEWKESLDPADQEDVAREFTKGRKTVAVSSPQWLLDYKEVAPGQWFPMTQGHAPYAGGGNTEPWLRSQRDMRIVEVQVNADLPDELFEMEFKEGVEVVDTTHDPFLVYKYKKDRTPEEWEQIIAEAQERDRDQNDRQAAMDELVGQPAPAFSEATWLNSDPLTWADLKGQVVVVDFWAEWCGPCYNDLPTLRDLHERQKETGITVISIHTAGSRMEAIEKVMEEYKLEYPVYIDQPSPQSQTFGSLFGEYAVRAIPHAFIVDREGKIAGHGRLGEVLETARALADK